MTAASIPGAIIGLWGPEGRYVRAVGVADKATGAPMKADFYSRIGSMTKTFTVTAILQLAEQGKIGLDDPIGKYIDGVPQGDKITLRQLARMRSGLENYAKTPEFQQALVADPYRNFTPQELLGYAFAAPSRISARRSLRVLQHQHRPVGARGGKGRRADHCRTTSRIIS